MAATNIGYKSLGHLTENIVGSSDSVWYCGPTGRRLSKPIAYAKKNGKIFLYSENERLGYRGIAVCERKEVWDDCRNKNVASWDVIDDIFDQGEDMTFAELREALSYRD